MKKIALTISSFAFMALISCGPSSKDAVAYNDKIMDVVNKLTVSHNAFLGQIDGHNIDSLKITHQLFADNAKASLDEIGKLGTFADKKDFSDAATTYFTSINSMVSNEGKQMVEIMSKDSSQVTMDDVTKVEELASKFDAIYDKSFNDLQAAQAKFSEEWKFKLEDKKEEH